MQRDRHSWSQYGRWLGLLSLCLPSVAVAAPSAVANVSTPVPVEVDFQSNRVLMPDTTAYSLGNINDYLPDAVPQATQIVLRLGERRVYVYGDDQVLASYPVAIGTPSTPTPTGEFEIFQMIVNPSWQSPWTGEVFPPGPNSALGVRWIGFTELPNGIIGFHGTPTISSIGRAASNGCVRLRNEDVVALFEHARLGMTVIVEP